MEEFVGRLWDRWITRVAAKRYPDQVVTLEQMSKAVGLWFRAFGGDPALQVEAATATAHGARRSWVERIAGSARRVELAWHDERALRLPARIDVFPSHRLNRDLYLWLTVLAAQTVSDNLTWWAYNQTATRRVLSRFAGLRSLYTHLVETHIALRPAAERLPADEREQELAIRMALRVPGSVDRLPKARHPHQPVPLWLHPSPPMPLQLDTAADGTPRAPAEEGRSRSPKEAHRRQAERVSMPDGHGLVIPFRAEAILSWAEFVRVNRGTDESSDAEAERAADDLDVISVARDRRSTANRLRFDLDLPAPANDDLQLGEGILLPEWDYRRGRLVPDRCAVQVLVAADAEPRELPARLRVPARRLRRQFEVLVAKRVWRHSQPDGMEVDLEAYLRFRAQQMAQSAAVDCRLYRDLRSGLRDLACLLLADLSMSTDAWLGDHGRVIDVIREGLLLFAEALDATGDRYALYGFSSCHRSHVRVHLFKTFEQPYSASVRGRLAAIRPGFYTRMGAAIRYATDRLVKETAARRLLLLLTDGRPNDLDHYEGRHGIEDTRMAIIEARRAGLYPFCVTIDEKASGYLPYLFGNGGYVLVRKPEDLPRELPLLYSQLTQR